MQNFWCYQKAIFFFFFFFFFFFKVNNLTDLFENVKIDDILSFLRETELYQKVWQLKTG